MQECDWNSHQNALFVYATSCQSCSPTNLNHHEPFKFNCLFDDLPIGLQDTNFLVNLDLFGGRTKPTCLTIYYDATRSNLRLVQDSDNFPPCGDLCYKGDHEQVMECLYENIITAI